MVAGAALVVWRQPILAFVTRSSEYIGLVRVELKKVSWPTWNDLQKSTVVIVIIILVVGAIIGLMDLAFSKILIDFFGRAFGR